jgi:hypothetical protein
MFHKQLDPLGLTFMLVFGIIMVIQVIGMIVHRTGTFLHIMSTTSINCCSSDDPDDERRMSKEAYVKLAREMGRLIITEEPAPRRAAPPSQPPPAPPAGAPNPAPVEPDRRKVASRKRNRRKKKTPKGSSVNNLVSRQRASSRTAPTVHDAFNYRLERLRRMTETDVNTYIQVRIDNYFIRAFIQGSFVLHDAERCSCSEALVYGVYQLSAR